MATAAWSRVIPVPVRIVPTSGVPSLPQTPVSQPSVMGSRLAPAEEPLEAVQQSPEEQRESADRLGGGRGGHLYGRRGRGRSRGRRRAAGRGRRRGGGIGRRRRRLAGRR